ncbi:MAG: sulfurtransferase [Gammaproteobacteria bacterium]|nr:sulfurtransferase [Gammaproteobacteria bacterium]
MQLDGPLVSTDWLAAHLDEPGLRIYDTTIYLRMKPDGFGYLPESGRDEWAESHIPGAGFLDVLGELSDAGAGIPFMMPEPAVFAATMASHGVADGTTVVLYNKGFPMWSTRVWWMLRSIGFDNVAVLNGGWEKWTREGHPVTADVTTHPQGQLSVNARPQRWADKARMLDVITSGSPVTINALSPEVYSGDKNQYGRPGHLPGTHNVFYGSLIDPDTNEFLPPDKLAPLFAASGALEAPEVITYCGGGISATMDCLALELCGQRNVAVYDGSMSEWVKDESLPLKLGSEP